MSAENPGGLYDDAVRGRMRGDARKKLEELLESGERLLAPAGPATVSKAPASNGYTDPWAEIRREIGPPTDRDHMWEPMVSAGEVRALLARADRADQVEAQIRAAFWECFSPDIGGVDWRDDAAIQRFARTVEPLIRERAT